MTWFELTLDSEAKATLNRFSATMALLATSIKQNGDLMATAIDLLTQEIAKFTQTEAALASAVQAVVKALQDDAAKIADLTNQLAQSNDAAIQALIPEFDSVADKLNADAVTLQGAIPPQT